MKPTKTPIMAAAALILLLSQASAAQARKAALDVDWLVKPAERAILNSQFARAALLFQGALALREEDPDLLWRLAEVYTMGGQFSLAQDTYREWLKVGKDAAKTARAKAEIQRLANAPAPFVEGDDTAAAARQRTFAMQAVKKAQGEQRRKAYRVAIRYLKAALVMDPTLVGAYRLIGTLYGRLKDSASEQAYYVKYLRTVPGGRIAGMVRRKLQTHPEIGKVTFEASFPCMVFLNRGLLDEKKKTPLKDIALPSGEYTVVFYNAEYHFGQKSRVTVTAGKTVVVKAEFGVIDIKLNPWARVRAKKEGTRGWRDLGLWETVGLPSGKWLVDFKTDDGKRTMQQIIDLTPGKVARITAWK